MLVGHPIEMMSCHKRGCSNQVVTRWRNTNILVAHCNVKMSCHKLRCSSRIATRQSKTMLTDYCTRTMTCRQEGCSDHMLQDGTLPCWLAITQGILVMISQDINFCVKEGATPCWWVGSGQLQHVCARCQWAKSFLQLGRFHTKEGRKDNCDNSAWYGVQSE